MPTTEELERFYQSNYWPSRNPDLDTNQYLNCPRAKAQTEFIESAIPDFHPTSILEIGAAAATPSLLFRSRHRGKREINIHVIEAADMWNDYYRSNRINRAGHFFPSQLNTTFSHIHASHWLEHTTDPQEAASTIFSLLEEDGSVFVEVPYADKEYWDLPISDSPHTLFFSQESLNSLFTSQGFDRVVCRRFGISLQDWAQGIWPSPSDYGKANNNGFWIRALYRKRTASGITC